MVTSTHMFETGGLSHTTLKNILSALHHGIPAESPLYVIYIYTHHDTPIILSKAIVNHPKFYIFYGRESNYQFTWVVYQSLLYKH